jgi:lipopolysaccharide transport system ATP-binding protein
VPTPAGVELPVGYWLMPALLATTVGTPVIWNAVGVWTDSPAAPRHDDVFNNVLAASYLVGARDEPSQSYLARRAPAAPVRFIPDTAFSLARYWPSAHPSDEYTSWRGALGVDALANRYVVLQANPTIARYRSTIESVLRMIGDVTLIVLPVCSCHGDRAESVPGFGPGRSRSMEWLRPTLIRDIIAHAELVIASSLHACITAVCYGVPVVRAPVGPVPDDLKYAMLDGFDGVATIDDAPSIARVVQRGCRMEPRAEDYAERLERYWDQVADVAINGRPLQREHSMALMLRWLAKSAGTFGGQNRLARSDVRA